MKCETCKKELVGLQRKFCCVRCKHRSTNNKHQDYAAQQRRGLTRKLMFVNQLGGKCIACGYSKNLASLTFHHLDPSKKELELDIRRMSNNSLEVLTEEVAKCKLMCRNCHGELHHPQLEMVGLTGLEPVTQAL